VPLTRAFLGCPCGEAGRRYNCRTCGGSELSGWQVISLGESGRGGFGDNQTSSSFRFQTPSRTSGRLPGSAQAVLRSDCTARSAASETSASNSEATCSPPC